MKNQELQLVIINIDDLIRKALPKTHAIMHDVEKVLKECEWNEALVEGLFIFNKDIFPNETMEAKIIWTEIIENIVTHMDNMLLSPIKWTVENRFWLNSKFICTHLGLTNLKDRKSQELDETSVTLSNCTMTESETFNNEAKLRRSFEDKMKKEKSVIFGKLQTPAEMRHSAENPTVAVLDAVHALTGFSPEIEEEVLLGAVINAETLLSIQEDGNTFLQGKELMCQRQISAIMHQCVDRKESERVNSLVNMTLSNSEWKLLIDQAAAGDTIDTKNILVAWQALKNNPKGNFNFHIENPPGTRATCNHTDWQKGKRKVCSRYINNDEEFCTPHKALRNAYEENRKTRSLFPVYFGEFIFYIEPVYEEGTTGFYPMTFGMGRELMTKEYEIARGNKNLKLKDRKIYKT